MTRFLRSIILLLLTTTFLLTTSCKQEEESNAEMRATLTTYDEATQAASTGGEVKIWKGAALLWKDYQPTGNQPTNTYNQMQRLVLQYWLQSAEERKFPIALWQLNRLFDKSPSGEIALKVTNIADLTKVDAEWVAYNSRIEARLTAPKGQAVHYFVFEKQYFTGPITLNSGKQIEGMSKIGNPNDHIIWMRIGKDMNNQYCAFLNVAECIPFKADDRTRNGGAAGGAKIPAN